MGLYQEFNKLADMCYLDKIEFDPEEEEIQDDYMDYINQEVDAINNK